MADSRFDEARTAFEEALQLGDALAASALYADDARLLAPSAELFEGREAIAAFWRAGIESGVTHVELESLAVEERGDVAHEIGRYLLRLEPDGGDAVVDRGKYLLVHERQQDGSWRRAVEMFNPEGSSALRPGAHTPELRKRREQ